MLDAVLFDLDGTLTDPEVGITGSFRHALATRAADAALADAGVAASAVDLVVVATAKPHEQACTTLEHFGIADRFSAVGAASADGATRPKQVIVADALTQLGYRPPLARGSRPAVAMVGDRLHDVHGGRVNGCTTVAVEWGFAQPGELDAHAPDHRVADVAELLALLRRLS